MLLRFSACLLLTQLSCFAASVLLCLSAFLSLPSLLLWLSDSLVFSLFFFASLLFGINMLLVPLIPVHL